ncbi:MAG: acyl-CoA dehydrogenase family protein, partial [Chloroflexota bacterium]|nr:acyl-CoA dehydrogenase family protein [Chloroflexota bacterium]
MSGFGFTESQEMFRQEVRNFARRELAPGAKARAKGDTIPLDLWKKVANAGFTGINLPEEYGGQPADWVTVGILIEEVGRVEFALYHPILMGIAAGIVLKESSEEVRREWLPAVIRGDRIICLALTEPGCGSDAAALTTRAVRDGDHYAISGEKTSITQGMQADAALLFAKTDPAARARGVSCFLVPLDLPGVVRSGLPTMGFRPLKAASIILDGVRIPARYRMGEEGRGFHMVMGQFDVIRPCLGLAALGAAQASLEEAIAYAKQRTAFGQPIGKFEGVSFKIAEHL